MRVFLPQQWLPGNFYLTTYYSCPHPIQGSVGSCNCGYIMFSKRSGNSPHKNKAMDDTNQILHHLNTELSTTEILEALDILDRVNNSKNEDYINDLSEKEVNQVK